MFDYLWGWLLQPRYTFGSLWDTLRKHYWTLKENYHYNDRLGDTLFWVNGKYTLVMTLLQGQLHSVDIKDGGMLYRRFCADDGFCSREGEWLWNWLDRIRWENEQ